ncbi:hypothetical protein D3C77_690320 [compost metagenome]
MLPGATGFEQFAAGVVQVLGEGEVAQGGAPGSGAACGTGGGGGALAAAERVAKDLDPVAVLLVLCFASDFRDLNISVESHGYCSL